MRIKENQVLPHRELYSVEGKESEKARKQERKKEREEGRKEERKKNVYLITLLYT